jgi:hypothetical protein
MVKAIRFSLGLAAAILAGLLRGQVRSPAGEGFPENEADQKVYRLKQTCPQSRIDASFLERIDSVTPPFPAGSPYQIGDIPSIPGRLTVYKFVALYRGESAEGKGDFHDLLVIETDSAGAILDGYHYTLEWTDVPTLDLFRLRGKGVNLKDGLKIQELKLANVRTGAPLAEEGLIVLKK